MAASTRDGGSAEADKAPVEYFISKWRGQEGGQERANYALFLTELCGALGLPHPEAASTAHETNDYVFERVVQEAGRDGAVSNRLSERRLGWRVKDLVEHLAKRADVAA